MMMQHHTSKGAQGRYGHAASGPPTSVSKYKSKVCIFWLQPEGCPYGGHCLFAHGAADLASSAASRESPAGTAQDIGTLGGAGQRAQVLWGAQASDSSGKGAVAGSSPFPTGAPGQACKARACSLHAGPAGAGGGYKVQLCRHWVASQGTHCPHGIRCTYAHGAEEQAHYSKLQSGEATLAALAPPHVPVHTTGSGPGPAPAKRALSSYGAEVSDGGTKKQGTGGDTHQTARGGGKQRSAASSAKKGSLPAQVQSGTRTGTGPLAAPHASMPVVADLQPRIGGAPESSQKPGQTSNEKEEAWPVAVSPALVKPEPSSAFSHTTPALAPSPLQPLHMAEQERQALGLPEVIRPEVLRMGPARPGRVAPSSLKAQQPGPGVLVGMHTQAQRGAVRHGAVQPASVDIAPVPGKEMEAVSPPFPHEPHSHLPLLGKLPPDMSPQAFTVASVLRQAGIGVSGGASSTASGSMSQVEPVAVVQGELLYGGVEGSGAGGAQQQVRRALHQLEGGQRLLQASASKGSSLFHLSASSVSHSMSPPAQPSVSFPSGSVPSRAMHPMGCPRGGMGLGLGMVGLGMGEQGGGPVSMDPIAPAPQQPYQLFRMVPYTPGQPAMPHTISPPNLLSPDPPALGWGMKPPQHAGLGAAVRLPPVVHVPGPSPPAMFNTGIDSSSLLRGAEGGGYRPIWGMGAEGHQHGL